MRSAVILSCCHFVKKQSDLAWVQVALKCSDIGHLACPLPLHQRWTAQLRDEFFFQGDLERKRGLRVSALMDRGDPSGMLKSQANLDCP